VPLPRFEKLPDERRREVLDHAIGVFAQAGYEGTSYNRIMADLGLSKGAAYYWFADKEDLFRTVLAESIARLHAALGDVPVASSRAAFWRDFRAAFARIGDFYRQEPAAAVLAIGLLRRPDDPTLTASGEKWFETLIAEGRRVGAVRSDLPGDLLAHLTFSIAEAGDQWLAHHVQDPGSDPRVPEIVASLTDIVESVLRASRTKGGSAT
jgi:AcrR family transcriptional regulator